MSNLNELKPISLNNKRICDFYNNNPHIDVETMNLILIDFIEQIGTDLSKMLNQTITKEILSNVKDIKYQLSSLNDSITIKINESNKEFIQQIKIILESILNSSINSSINNTLTSTLNSNFDKINSIYTHQTESLLSKVSLLIPQSNEKILHSIQEIIQSSYSSIHNEIQDFAKEQQKEDQYQQKLNSFLSTIENKITISQQPIFTIINSIENLMHNNLSNIKHEYSSLKDTNQQLYTELNNFLSKYKSSSQYKGQVSEIMIEELLNKLFPTGDITNNTSLPASGDFILRRENKPDIIFENKNYQRNVNVEEVKKFIRDITDNKTCGIMMSQKSGIVGKPDYFIEIHENKILVYLHNVEYSTDKIKTAVDIIDKLYEKLDSITHSDNNSGTTIKKETLDKINEQYQLFITQKENLINTTKDIQKKLISQIEDLCLPDLSSILNDNYASVQNQDFTCDICHIPFSNRRSLAAHKKAHKNKTPKDNIIIAE